MAEKETGALQPKEKQELDRPETTKPGKVFTPDVDIFETKKEMTLLADMPGVQAEALDIDLNDNVLTLSGDVTSHRGANEEDLRLEYEEGRYYRQFTISEKIDQANIDASLTDGILRLRLPKAEKTIPRKITVQQAA